MGAFVRGIHILWDPDTIMHHAHLMCRKALFLNKKGLNILRNSYYRMKAALQNLEIGSCLEPPCQGGLAVPGFWQAVLCRNELDIWKFFRYD